MSFESFRLHSDLLRGVRSLGFVNPTPIQLQAIPPVMDGKDVLARAMTGSGKTAAFGLPILHRLIGKPRGTTRALILTPTRELAAQVAEDLARYAAHTPLKGAAIYGGVNMGPQERALKNGVDVVVATPGRLLDHLRHGYAALRGLEVLVLDEADRMLDIGFLPDIRRILRHLPAGARRQTLLFSATLPAEIVGLAREILRDPVSIDVTPGKGAAPAAGVTHSVYPVPSELKSALLAELVKRGEIRSVIAFTRTKHRANRLADYLLRQGIGAARIHGNRSQAQRTQALAGLKAGKVPGPRGHRHRGPRHRRPRAVSHVVNFDVPNSPEDYVHRVGRTARAEAQGDAFLFVSPEEEGDVARIERAIGKRLPRVMLSEFDYRKKPAEKLEVPLQERFAAIRAQRSRGHRPPSRAFGARRGSSRRAQPELRRTGTR